MRYKRKSRCVSLHASRGRPSLEPLHEIRRHSWQLSASSVRRLRESQLRQQTLLDNSQTVFAGVFVRAARGAEDVRRRRLLRAGEVRGNGRQPRGEQQQARGPGPRPARRAQRTRGAAERGGGAGGSAERHDVRPRATRATLRRSTPPAAGRRALARRPPRRLSATPPPPTDNHRSSNEEGKCACVFPPAHVIFLNFASLMIFLYFIVIIMLSREHKDI